MVEKITSMVFHSLQQLGIKFQPGFEFECTYRDGIPNGESPFAFEFQLEINQGVFAVLVNKAPQGVQLCKHASGNSNKF